MYPERKKSNRKRTSASILTSSPYKKSVEIACTEKNTYLQKFKLNIINKEPTNSNIQLLLNIGDAKLDHWYAMIYANKIYPGIVTNKDNLKITMKCMRIVGEIVSVGQE